jgi:hypothetical protein
MIKTSKQILKKRLKRLMGKGTEVTFETVGHQIIATGKKKRVINDEEGEGNTVVSETASISMKKD